MHAHPNHHAALPGAGPTLRTSPEDSLLRGAWSRCALPGLLSLVVLASLTLVRPSAQAYPPAPHHVIEGVVRDAFGNPLQIITAQVILATSAGNQVIGRINPELDGGLNYTLTIPMDAGLTADAYRPTALQPLVPFKISVQLGGITYLPIEMTGDYANLGLPAQRTRLDLTLGEDLDGDGLPDAWERALIQMLGGDLSLSDIHPGDDADGDGLSNLQEYLAGTYAYDPAHGIALDMVAFDLQQTTLEFTAIRGRTYTILASDDMRSWTQVPMTLVGAVPAVAVPDYRSTDLRPIRVTVPSATEDPDRPRFFKLMVR